MYHFDRFAFVLFHYRNEMRTPSEIIAITRRLRDRANVQTILLLFVLLQARTRNSRYSRHRIDVDLEIEMLLNENMFEQTFRMTADSFSYLLGLLTPNIEVNRQQSANSSGEEPISPPLMLMTTLRYLAGGSYLDIRRTV